MVLEQATEIEGANLESILWEMTNELACGGTVGNNLVFLVRKHGTQPIQEAEPILMQS